jgi:hypothetical protein
VCSSTANANVDQLEFVDDLDNLCSYQSRFDLQGAAVELTL